MRSASSDAGEFEHAKVLVTGGLGFIGSNLARRLVELRAEVTLVDSIVPEYGGNPFNLSEIGDRVRLNVSDVRDPYSLAHLVADQDFVFNLAGQTSHLDSMEDPHTDLEMNCKAQLSILEACRRVNPDVRLVFASTRQVYGKPDSLPVNEAHPVRPVDVNGINKAAGEAYHLLYDRVYGIRSHVLRLTNTYGPRMRVKDARQTFLGVWIRELVEGRPFEVWGGSQLRDFTYVDDVSEALLLTALHTGSETNLFNVGGCEVVTLRGLAEILIDVNGSGEFAVKEFPAERKRIDIGDYYADGSLIEKELGWKPVIGLREGLAQTLSFYRQHIERYR